MSLIAVALLSGGCGQKTARDDTSCETLALLECESQVLRLADRITGTTFDLVYASDRVAGRPTLSPWDARAYGLGGWTLSVLHHFEPERGVLFYGDGRTIRVGKGVPFKTSSGGTQQNGLLVASEDGTEVYFFDESGRHLRTLDALTGGARFSSASTPRGD